MITSTVTTYTGDVPVRTQEQATFNTNVNNILTYIANILADAINDVCTEINSTTTGINTSESNAASSASAASSSASSASTSASNAAASASSASTSASNASASASSASSSASSASTSASNASDSADAAAASAAQAEAVLDFDVANVVFKNVAATISAAMTHNANITIGSGYQVFTVNQYKTGAFTAVNGGNYQCDTSSSGWTVTLPASPSVGTKVTILNPAWSWADNNLTVGRNGKNIAGVAANLVIDKNVGGLTFEYTTSKGWIFY